MSQTSIKAVLFDLDGTLLDTAPDLAKALNIVLERYNRAPLPYAKIRPLSSGGSKGLLGLGFQITEDHPDYPSLREQFLSAYHDHLKDGTQIFPGIAAVLTHIEDHGMQWGVVTNKPIGLAEQLMAHFNLVERTACLIGGDSLAKRKPDPDQLLYAADQIGCHPNECIYVGDAARDIQAAKSANMRSLAALYGYINEGEDPYAWQADHYLKQPHEIIDWLQRLKRLSL